MDLRQTERRAFRAAYDDGLWDVLLAFVVMMFALAPLLSRSLGDLWSSVVFVPLWAVVYVAIGLIRRHVVVQRVGMVRFGSFRRRRLRTMTTLLLAVNVVAFAGGLAALAFAAQAGWLVVIVFWLIVLALFSIAGHYLETPRLYLYGLMLAAAAAIGEWLFREGYATHHGYPVMFGASAFVIALFGVIRFARIWSRTRPPAPENTAEPHEP